MKTLIGIDPGWGGGLAVLRPEGLLELHKMPSTELGVWELFLKYQWDTEVYIELVHAMPVNGSVANFKLGQNWGALRAAMSSMNIGWTEVAPVVWQKRLQPLPKGPGKARTERKALIKAKMKANWPSHAQLITNATADALAILEYGLEQEQGSS